MSHSGIYNSHFSDVDDVISSSTSVFYPYFVNFTQDSGASNFSVACNTNTIGQSIWSTKSNIADIVNGDVLYSSPNLSDVWFGNLDWYGLATSGFTRPARVFQVTTFGVVATLEVCAGSPSITPSISISPSITPSLSPTGPIPTVDNLCMNVEFGSAPSVTPSISPSVTPSITPSITPSRTVAPSMTPSPTISVSVSPSLTPLPSISITPSISISPSITPLIGTSPTPTPSLSPTGSIPTVAGLCMNIEFGSAPSVTPSISVSRTPTVTPSVTPSITPSITPSNTNPPPTPSNTPSISPSRTPSITPSRTPSRTISPTPSPSAGCTPCSLANVVIGEQTWTACNLDVTTYRNGDPIPQVTDPTAWNNLTTGAWCYYQNNPSLGCTYNKLYNWYAVNDPRGLAPVGYHVPTEAEIETLRQYLGGTNVAGGKLKQAGTTLWNSPNTGATNETGWTGLPGGALEFGQFGGIRTSGPFWTSTTSPVRGFENMALYADLYSFNSQLDIKAYNKTSGYAVRLLKDIPNPDACNTILYKTQGNQYYSYNFPSNTSTLLNVPTPPSEAVSPTNPPRGVIANTSNKLWSYTFNTNGSSLSNNSIVEYNTTNNPFTATINRYIALPKILNNDITAGTGLFAISNTKLIGTINNIGGQDLSNVFSESEFNNPTFPLRKYANGTMVVEYDIASNVAIWTLKVKLLPYEKTTGGLLLTLDNKLIVLTKATNEPKYYISQYNYTTGVLEFRSLISPTVASDCGLVEINNEIYIMGYNTYKFNRTTYALELIQSPQTQLVASSQLAGCINVNLPTSSCPECVGLPLKLSTPVTYGGVTISPTYTGPLYGAPNFIGAIDTLYPGYYTSCTGSSVLTHPSYSIWLGASDIQSSYTYSLNFSQPVNDIKLIYNGTNNNETFIWDTNGGTPNLTLCKSCYQTINGNIVSGNWDNSTPGNPIGGGGVMTISAPLNYTTLTLKSPGGNKGTIFGICSGSIVPQPANTLGCVYYSTVNSSNQPITYLYNAVNNTSAQVTLPTDTFTSFAETHTSTKYWKGNQTSTIKEWIPTSTPNVLALNRTINVSGITSVFGNYFILLAAVNDTTLLTTVQPTGTTTNLVSMNIIDTNVVANDLATLFTFTDQFVDSMLLTSNNKIITIGRTGSDTYLTQYSYPTGTQEVRVNISSVGFTPDQTQKWLFESNGNLYFSKNNPFPTSIIYQVNLNSPYTITPIYDNSGAFYRSYNSSIECNTVALNVAPLPQPSPSVSPSPTPSLTPPVSPNVGVNTIYKYLDIL